MYCRPRSLLPVLLMAAACQPRSPAVPVQSTAATVSRATLLVHDTTIDGSLEVAGIAAPIREATLGTTLVGSVTEVLVHEGQVVHAGDVLARIDARDVNARGTQAAAGVAQAEAVLENARLHARRLQALYADSAAAKAQLDDANASLARAEAGARAAHGAAAEVEAMRAYADIRSPFDGIVTKRHVDPGSFVMTGTPLITVQDVSRLRLSVTATPADVHGMLPGTHIDARIEGQPASAVVEGIVPATGNAVYVVNALVDNPSGKFLAGASAALFLPRAARTGILLPEAALVHEGDLVGVRVRAGSGGTELRWLLVARVDAAHVEVLSGLHGGETVELGNSAARDH